MRIKYDVTIDDVVAFNRYHSKHSPTIKRTKRFCSAIGVIAICIIVPLISPIEDFVWSAKLALTAFAAVTFYVAFQLLFVRSLDKQVIRLVREGSTAGIIGSHELEITEETLTERTDSNTTSARWQGIADIAETETHVFFYQSALLAHVVPKNQITEGDLSSFVERAVAYWRKAQESNADSCS
ncbi:MAG: hypothetical protein Fues2KO_14240 [Fuerstiella sp.]